MTKPATAYSAVAKPATSYSRNPSAPAGVTADSTTVTAASLVVYATGYTTATPPQLDNRPVTQYGSVTKPATAYSAT